LQSFQTFQSLHSFLQTFIDIVAPQFIAPSEIFVIVSVKNVIENSERSRTRSTTTNRSEPLGRDLEALSVVR
jgi:hypothetical protein